MTADTIAIEPDVLEYKLYAPGVGIVMALGVSGGARPRGAGVDQEGQAATASAAGTAPLGTAYE